jgi:hypothetical protein
MLRVLTSAVLVLISGVARTDAQPRQPTVPADVEELLWWLPPDTETVEVIRIPANPRGPLRALAQTPGEIVADDMSYAEILTRHLKGTRIKATIEGSRHFRPPAGLGEMQYEGAALVRFETPLGERGPRLMADLKQRARKVDRFDGLVIVEFSDQVESDVVTSSLTIPGPDLLVIATNRAYLEELLRRRKSRAQARALPGDLPEWQWVDVTAPYWALRHHRHDAPGDPTSPFERRNGMDAFDTGALGVTAHVGADGRTVVAHYLSLTANAEQIARRIWDHPGDGVAPAFRRADTNVIEVRFVATDEDNLSMFFFYLMGALGHATYV